MEGAKRKGKRAGGWALTAPGTAGPLGIPDNAMARPVHSDVPPMAVQCLLPPSQKCQCFLVLLCNALQCAEEGGARGGLVMQSRAMPASSWMPGNSIAHITTSHLISSHLSPTCGSPLSAHHPSPPFLLRYYSSPFPISSHISLPWPGATGGTSGWVAAV